MWFSNFFAVKPFKEEEIEMEALAHKRRRRRLQTVAEENNSDDEFSRNILNRYYRR